MQTHKMIVLTGFLLYDVCIKQSIYNRGGFPMNIPENILSKLTDEQKKDLEQTDADIKAQEDKKNDVLANFAKSEDKVHHLIDLALLQNGMLRGEALDSFVKRSIELIK